MSRSGGEGRGEECSRIPGGARGGRLRWSIHYVVDRRNAISFGFADCRDSRNGVHVVLDAKRKR